MSTAVNCILAAGRDWDGQRPRGSSGRRGTSCANACETIPGSESSIQRDK